MRLSGQPLKSRLSVHARLRHVAAQDHRIRALAADFPALWSDPATPQRERKRMARLLIDDVTMTKTGRIHLHVRFRGGQTTSLDVPIPPPAWQLRQTKPEALTLLDRLLDDHTDGETAAALNAAGHRSGEGKPFTSRIVLDSLKLLRQARERLGQGLRAIEAEIIAESDKISLRNR